MFVLALETEGEANLPLQMTLSGGLNASMWVCDGGVFKLELVKLLWDRDNSGKRVAQATFR